MPAPHQSTWKSRCGWTAITLSVALGIVITASFFGRWDAVAAITLFPYWSWALVGGALACTGSWLLRNRAGWALMAPWAVASLVFSDNLVPMLRSLRHSEPSGERPGFIRVVTLNCAGSPAAAAELESLKPDLVLLQEIPSTIDLARLTREWFGNDGTFVAGFDCAILSRAPLQSIDTRFPPQFVRAVLRLPGRRPCLVTSLRLIPPEGRFDLWNPSAWRASTVNRRSRRNQLREVLRREPSEQNLPEILGGDFNAPVSDAVFWLLADFHDAHAQAGHGWGNTVLNHLPVARPDQIWLKHIDAVLVRARTTRNSDHRLVVADLDLSR